VVKGVKNFRKNRPKDKRAVGSRAKSFYLGEASPVSAGKGEKARKDVLKRKVLPKRKKWRKRESKTSSQEFIRQTGQDLGGDKGA